jgi:hypothetical protein
MSSLTGDLELVPLTEVCRWLSAHKASFTLTARRNQSETKFFVRNGHVQQAHSTDPREYLGQHLINFGYISEEQLQRAFETQQETHVPLGRVLVMVDAISHEQLMRVAVFKARESILDAMCWDEGSFRVETNDVTPDPELDCDPPIALNEVVSEAAGRRRMWAEILRVFPSDGVRVEVLGDASSTSALDQKLLHILGQGRSVGEACLELRAMNFQVYARLYDLHSRGIIKPRLKTTVATHPLPRTPTPVMRAPDVELDVSIDVDEPTVPAPVRLQTPPPNSPNTYILVRPERVSEPAHVQPPPEALDPGAALRVALATRNWPEAHLLSQRMLEQDPLNTEAIAAFRVADAQLRKQKSAATDDLHRVPQLVVDPAMVATAHLTSKERYVLSRIDGKRTVQQIVAVSPIQATELIRIIDAFVARGVLSG